MAATHFSGPVVSANGFVDGTGNPISGSSIIVGSTTISEAEIAVLDGVTAGTAAASKAVVLDANKDVATVRNVTASGTVTTANLTTSATVIMANLPVVDPEVVGQLWNDGGILTISAGP